MEITNCPKCKQKSVFHNKGISKKTNKPYENEKCSKCDYIKWIEQDPRPEGWAKTAEIFGKKTDFVEKNSITQDFVDVMTSIHAKVSKILEMLAKEMPEEDEVFNPDL